MNLYLPTPVQELQDPEIASYGVRVLVKRDDLIHPVVSGNKWRKLKYNLAAARRQGHHTLLTFGGAYSNHIHAAAGAAAAAGFNSIGVIRGEPHEPLNPTLAFAERVGMRLHYMDRARYRLKQTTPVIAELRRRFGDFYLLPEGGSNGLAVHGCSEIVDELRGAGWTFDAVVCACGSGGTLAGLAAGLPRDALAVGVAALKGGGFLRGEVQRLLEESGRQACCQWDVALDYHCGGYARLNDNLVRFVRSFTARHGIPVEPIYTGKMFFGLYDLIRNGYFSRGETVVALHTGGLQGLAGMAPRIQIGN